MRAFLALASVAVVMGLAPFHPAPAGAAVQGQYIVVFSRNATQAAVDKHLGSTVGVKNTYDIGGVFRGYSALFSDAQLQTARADSAVAYIENDQVVHAIACQSQQNAEWNLDRTSARTAPDMSGAYRYDDATKTGKDVNVYIIDTGIRVSHQEFGTRASWGTNTVGDGNDSDCNGHGTHVAGTVGGKEYGVAKETNLIAVKVLSCGGSGTWDGVISGINWSATHHRASGKRIAVLNMSLGGGFMSAVNDATNAAVDAGIVAAVASGNSNADACNFSPASASKAIGTNAQVVNDQNGVQVDGRSYFSNFGQCTAIFAPGTNVKSAYHTSDTATATLSGTSMASPHVAGVVAQLISSDSTLDTPAKILTTIQANAGKDLVNMGCTTPACQQTPNLMLHSSC